MLWTLPRYLKLAITITHQHIAKTWLMFRIPAQRMVFVLVDWSQNSGQYHLWNTYLFPLSGFLYHANPVLDPVFYSLMSRRFQDIHRQIFCCRSNHRKEDLSHRSRNDSPSQVPRVPLSTNDSCRSGKISITTAAQLTNNKRGVSPHPHIPALENEDDYRPLFYTTTV